VDAGHGVGELAGEAGEDPREVGEGGGAVEACTVEQLAQLIPSLVPDRLAELTATGVVERCGPDRYCVPSPSLLALTADALDAGYDPGRVLALLDAIGTAARSVSEAVAATLAEPPDDVDRDRLAALATRGCGLLAHGTGRLAIHALGRRLGVTDDPTADRAIRTLLGVDEP
jgi:hypothetical protein